MNTFPLPQQIVDRLSVAYEIVIVKITLLLLGADMNAAVYRAETLDGHAYFVKVKYGYHDDISAPLLALFQASGIRQVIPPIQTTHGQLTSSFGGFTFIVYPFVEGENGFCRKLTDAQWVALGKVMRQVHAFDVPTSLKKQIRRETYSSKWREAVRSLDVYLDGHLTSDKTGLKLQAFMKEHQAVIHRLVDRAEVLSKKMQEQSLEFVLCHSDIHGEMY